VLMATAHAKHLKAKPPAVAGVRKGVASVTVGELRSNFKAVEAKLAKGVKVQIMRRGEVVAEMAAPAAEIAATMDFADRMPEFKARLRKIWGPRPVKIDTSSVISEGRERDLVF
jgi:antitoxin (DNA-binding transcriptional repressor) of toxin-antitoxin stability system